MTFQPPPSEDAPQRPSEASQAPATGGWSSLRTVHRLDWALLALGLATLIFSCFDFYRFSSGFYGSKGFSAWHDIAGGGFFGWFGVVLSLMGSVVLALALFESGTTFPLDARLIALYGWAVGLICELLAIVLHPKFYDGPVGKLSHGFSFWVILALTAVGTVVALAGAQRADTALPTPLRHLPKIG